MQAKDGTQLDPGVAALVKAIRTRESGGKYDAVGDNGTSRGAYQYQQGTWQARAKAVGADPNDFSPTNQDKVTYMWALSKKKEGWTPEQIAAAHNAGDNAAATGTWKTNKGVKTYPDGTKIAYDTPAYVNSVMADYRKQRDQYLANNNTSSAQPQEDTTTRIIKGVADAVADPFRELGSAAANIFRPPEEDVKSYTNFSGKDVNVPGYINGQEAGAFDTAVQAGGAGLGVAATVLPFMKAGQAALVARPILAGAGLGYAQDVSDNIKEGDTGASALIPGMGTALGGGLGVAGNVAKVIAKPASEMKAKALKEGLDAAFNKNQSVKNSYAKNTVVQNTGKLDAEGKPIMETITPDATMIKNEFKPKVVDGRMDTTHLIDEATGEGIIPDMQATIDDHVQAALAKTHTPVVSLADFQRLAEESVKGDKQLARLGKTEDVLGQIEKRFAAYSKTYPNGVPMGEVDNIRKAMNSVYNEATQDVDNAVGNAARNLVYNALPEGDTTIRDLLKQQQVLQVAKKYAQTLNGKVVKGGRLGNMFWTWIGQKIGEATGIPIAGNILGMLGGNAVSRGLQQLTFTSPMGELKSGITSLLKKSGATEAEIKPIVEELKDQLMLPAPKPKENVIPMGGKTMEGYNVAPDGTKTVPPAEIKVVPAKKNPTTVNPKTGKFQKTFNSTPGFAKTDLLAKIGIGSAAAVGATAGYNKLADKYGTETYTREPETPQENKSEPQEEGITTSVNEIAHAETRGEKTPYSFSQWSNKTLGPASPLGKALGKYQITEARLKEKSQDFLGKTVTPKEFLASPELQDAFIKAQVAWQKSMGLNDDEVLATHRFGWGHFKPEEIALAVKKAQPYIKMARS